MQGTGGPDRFNHLSLPAFKQHLSCTEVTCLPCKPAVSMSQELRSDTNSQRLGLEECTVADQMVCRDSSRKLRLPRYEEYTKFVDQTVLTEVCRCGFWCQIQADL